MKTTQHLDKTATSGSTASAIKAEEYDLLILGSGAAGKLLSWTLAKKGMKTAAIERKYVGGSCPNIACLPSKNIIHSAKVASYFRRSEEFGITDRKSTRLNSSHLVISYAVFCLKKKKETKTQ